MSDFTSILDMTVDNIKPPANVPTGQWLLRGVSYSTRDITYEDKNTGDPTKATVLNFRFEPLEPGAGVDKAQVDTNEHEGKSIYYTIFIPYKSNGEPNYGRAKGLKEFMDVLGLDQGGQTFREVLESFKGKTVAAQVKIELKTDKRDGREYMDNVLKDLEPATNFVSA